jgi:hypothetical protein
LFALCAGGVLFAAAADEAVPSEESPTPKKTAAIGKPATADKPAALNESATNSDDDSDATTVDVSNSKTAEDVPRVPIAVARDRAKLLHEVYLATLHVMHDRYFHADRSIVPARAMEDVFTEIERKTGSKANWISVNLRAMSINHEPKTDFEKRAAREIATGKAEVHAVEDGYYRQATSVSMTGGCISCHAGSFSQPSKSEKYSGLVISIPVESEVDEK